MSKAFAKSISASRHDRHLLASLLITLLIWNVPYGWYLLFPFKLFATWIHESSHGVTMLITGAGFEKMHIFRDTSGLAYPRHGVTDLAQAIISSAGYMGTSLFGGICLALSPSPIQARMGLAALSVLMMLSAVLFLRNTFGIVSIAAASVLVALAAWRLGPHGLSFLLSLLGSQCCINGLLDIRVLFGATMLVNGSPHGQTDAHTMTTVVGGPHWLWASLWLVWSLALFYIALRFLRLKRMEEKGWTG